MEVEEVMVEVIMELEEVVMEEVMVEGWKRR